MNCPLCKTRLSVAKTTTEEGYINQYMVCLNNRCPNYAGSDLNAPKAIATTLKSKVI